MRTILYIIFLVLLFSCNKGPEDKLQSFKDHWIKTDARLLSEERLEIRIIKALEYVKSHRAHWGFPLDGCRELQTDTLRNDRLSIRVALSPIKSPGADDDISDTLDQLWACKIYKQPFDSLITKISPTRGKYSEKNNLLIDYSNETMDSISQWKKKNSQSLEKITSSILKELPSSKASSQPVLFEVPTGKTIRVHLPATYSDLENDWDSLKYLPDQILFDSYADDIAIIFFDEKNNIEEVWWSGWIN